MRLDHYPQLSLASLRPHDHLCLIFDNRDGWAESIVVYLLAGVMRGDKCIYVADTSTRKQIRAAFKEISGLDIRSLEASGQFVIMSFTDTYVKEGYFDPDLMVGLLAAETEAALRQGYLGLRATGEMSWILRGYEGSDRLMEYEAKLNQDLIPHYPCTALCQYEQSRFGADIVQEMLLTHPLVAIGNQVYHNRMY